MISKQNPGQQPADSNPIESRPVPPSLGLVRVIAHVNVTGMVMRQEQVRPSAFVISPREIDFVGVKPGGEIVERRPDVDGSTLVMIPLWNWPTEEEAHRFLHDYLIRTNAYGYVLYSSAFATSFKKHLEAGTPVRDVPADDRFDAIAMVTVSRKGEFVFDLASVKTVGGKVDVGEWKMSEIEKVDSPTPRLEGVFGLLKW